MEELALGVLVYRNHDHAFLAALENSKTERKMAVRFRLAETREGLALFAQDDGRQRGHVHPGAGILPAEKPEQAAAAIETQLRKLGATEFECVFLRSDLPEPCFIPLGALNALRRGALEELLAERLRNFPRQSGGCASTTTPLPGGELSFEGNVLNERARAFYRRHGVTEIEPAAESRGWTCAGAW